MKHSIPKQRTSKQTVVTDKRSPLVLVLILSPLIVLFFFCGVYVGSQFMDVGGSTSSGEETQDRQLGLPGTNNNFQKWSKEKLGYLRGAMKVEGAKVAHVLSGLTPPKSFIRDTTTPEKKEQPSLLAPSVLEEQKPNHVEIVPKGLNPPLLPNSMYNERPAMPIAPVVPDGASGHVVSASELKDVLKSSLHATRNSYMKGPNDLDSSNIIVSAWVYLDDMGGDSDMRTIFTNKRSGCGNQVDQYGLSMYVNAWQTSDHRLYVEYGGLESGCHKLDSSGIQLIPLKWYHVAVHLGERTASLFIDGTRVSSTNDIESHQVSHKPLLVGQYDGAEFALNGNVSHLAVVNGDSAGATNAETVQDVVKGLMDVNKLKSVRGIVAAFPFTDAAHEVPSSTAAEVIQGKKGAYTFPAGGGTTIPGVSIKLIDGVGGRPVTDEMRAESDRLGRERREKVKDGMRHAWKGYKTYAWGRDEVKPLSKTGQDNWGGMGVTLVDSLDTLWVMGLKEEFKEARDWVARDLSFHHAGVVSMFETTIRELGGLLSAYDLSKDTIFLTKAKELGEMLLTAFDTGSGIPTSQVNMRSKQGASGWSGGSAILAELGTLQVEFRYLAHHAKMPNAELKSMKPLQMMHKQNPPHGLYPIMINQRDGSFADRKVTFGALGDSFYEYLLKVWIQGGKKETWLREMYDRAIDGVMEILLQTSSPSGLAFISDWNGFSNVRKMDHLVCFMPGALALGAHTDPHGPDSPRAKRDMAVAKALMYTCHEMYHRMKSGISPEYVEFPAGRDMVAAGGAPFYILRPETAESMFILNQLTGDPIYREWAWEIWEAIEKHCRTDIAYGALRDVNNPRAGVDDRMESFFLAETLKYLYLAQDPDKPIDLDKYVFNTEAHPMSIFDDTHRPVAP